MNMALFQSSSSDLPVLSEEDRKLLEKQDCRPVSEFRAEKFQSESRKHWDLFYKRNGDKFFKDRHWTTREFRVLASHAKTSEESCHLLEVGCGVGNFCLPLLADLGHLRVSACDFSQRAVQILKDNNTFGNRLRAFHCDISKEKPSEHINEDKADLLSLVFVLSALKPEDFSRALKNLYDSVRSGGMLLFRDYAVNDMTMIRFGPNTKIRDKQYLRQDGTTSYFFSKDELQELMTVAGFETKEVVYIHRETVNKKEGIRALRIFVQGVFIKR